MITPRESSLSNTGVPISSLQSLNAGRRFAKQSLFLDAGCYFTYSWHSFNVPVCCKLALTKNHDSRSRANHARRLQPKRICLQAYIWPRERTTRFSPPDNCTVESTISFFPCTVESTISFSWKELDSNVLGTESPLF